MTRSADSTFALAVLVGEEYLSDSVAGGDVHHEDELDLEVAIWDSPFSHINS